MILLILSVEWNLRLLGVEIKMLVISDGRRVYVNDTLVLTADEQIVSIATNKYMFVVLTNSKCHDVSMSFGRQ